MKSLKRGKNILEAEILNISKNGFWIMVYDLEYFLPFSDFPWFKNASINHIYNVQLTAIDHLHWPDLDVDLEVDSLKNLEKYPLLYTG